MSEDKDILVKLIEHFETLIEKEKEREVRAKKGGYKLMPSLNSRKAPYEMAIEEINKFVKLESVMSEGGTLCKNCKTEIVAFFRKAQGNRMHKSGVIERLYLEGYKCPKCEHIEVTNEEYCI